MFAKRFFYVSAAILCLALAYHLGATSATAQATKSQVVAAYFSNSFEAPSWTSAPSGNILVTATGDIYFNAINTSTWLKAGSALTP